MPARVVLRGTALAVHLRMSPLVLVSTLVVSSSMAIVLYVAAALGVLRERKPSLLLMAPVASWRRGARALPVGIALASLLYVGTALVAWGPQ